MRRGEARPEAVSKDDVEMLQDMIVAAINDANRKVDEQLGQSMSGHDGRPEASRFVLGRAAPSASRVFDAP